MKIQKTIVYVLLILIGLFLILNGLGYFYAKSAKSTKRVKSAKNTINKSIMTHQAPALFITAPDSLRSEEVSPLFRKLTSALYENCSINNDRFVVTISKKEWIKKGLPEIYYDIMKQDISDLNNFLDTTSFPKQVVLDSYLTKQEEYLVKKKLRLSK